jgi:hypothetical protein
LKEQKESYKEERIMTEKEIRIFKSNAEAICNIYKRIVEDPVIRKECIDSELESINHLVKVNEALALGKELK